MQASHPSETSLRLSLVPKDATLVDRAILAVAATVFIALCSHISVPLPFTPVPLTLGNMAVILVGLALGPSTAFAALVLYLGEGAFGLPVFNPGGPGGIAQLLGPTGGFLFAYPFAAAIAGATVSALWRRVGRFPASAFAATLGTALVLILGVLWLQTFAHTTLWVAVHLGAIPFLPGEIIKIAAAAGIYRAFQHLRTA